MARECYVFDTEAEAIAAEAYIAQVAGCPYRGRRASTGEVDETTQPTICWATPVQRPDGKWWFDRVPAHILAARATAEQITHFQTTYTYVIENFDPSWISE